MKQELVRLKQRTARLSVASNTALVVLKLLVGWHTGAVSILSEAAHSAVDLLAALIAWAAVQRSDLPPDERHAYGHGKIENLSGAAEAVLIVVAALWIVWEAAQKLGQPEAPEELGLGMAIMAGSIVLNWLVSARLLTVAAQTGSQALEADALHLRADIWTSVGVLAGLGLIWLTGLPWLDPAIALVVAVIVFRAGWRLTRDSFAELTDSSLPGEEEERIVALVKAHPEVLSLHRLRTRRAGSYRLLDMHVVLAKGMRLDQAHLVCDRLEAEIKEAFAPCDVVIHMDPCTVAAEASCENCPHCGPEKDRE